MAEGFQLAEPADEYRGDAVQGELGVDAEDVFRLAVGEVYGGVGAEAEFEGREILGGHGKAYGEGVTAEAGEEVGAAFEGVEELKSVNAATGAVGDFAVGSVFDADYDCGLGGPFDYTGGEDADDTAMPAVAVNDEEAVGGEFWIGEAGLDRGERGGFSVAAFAVEAFELGGEFVGAGCVAGGEELDDFGGDVHAAGGVDARGEAEGDVEAGDLLGGGIERGGGEEGAEAGAGGLTESTEAERGDDTVFTAQGDGIGDGGDGGHFKEAGQGFFAGTDGVAPFQNGLGELEGDGGAAEGFFRVSAAGLVGVENGEGVGDGVRGFEEVMVGDDEVEAESAGCFRFGEGAHAGVNGDDEADAIGIGGLNHAGLEAVAFAKAMGDVEADHAAEHFDGGL